MTVPDTTIGLTDCRHGDWGANWGSISSIVSLIAMGAGVLFLRTRMLRRNVIVLILALPLLFGPASPGAAWLYDGYEGRWAVPIQGIDSPDRGSNPAYWAAQRFWLPNEADVNQFGAQVGQSSDPNHAGFHVSLVTDTYDIQGTTLGKWTVYPTGGAAQYVYWDVPNIKLQANTDYALVFTPGDSMFSGSLAITYYGLYPLQFSTDQGAGWFDLSGAYHYPAAIRIGGTVVTPEPASGVVLALASGCLLLRLRFVYLDAHRQ